MKKLTATTFLNRDPLSTDNIAAGFPLGQKWYNTVTGQEFCHKTDGAWKSNEDVVRGDYRYDSQVLGSDTIGDWRTYSDGAGFYTQYCTLGNATKGAGTWVTKNTIVI